MRERKYRAWWECEDRYRMIDMDELQELDGEEFCIFTIMTSPKERMEGDNTAFMLYTGTDDIREQEIYEGDLISFGKNGLRFHSVGEVIFNDGGWCVKTPGGIVVRLHRCENKEIIGNVYENARLLKGWDLK